MVRILTSKQYGKPLILVLKTIFEETASFVLNFLKLCPSAISRNSNSTFSNPLNVNLLNLLLHFNCPKTASTSMGRLLRCSIPFSLINSSLALFLSSFNL